MIARVGTVSVICFAHHKGGTGKTTSCLNIAGFLTREEKKVLVIDTDPQGNATAGLGVDPGSLAYSMYDVFMGTFEGFPSVEIQEVIRKTKSGIDIAPANLELVGVEPFLYCAEDRATLLSDALDEVRDFYDYLLIDTPPSMGQFVINGLVASDHTVVTFDRGVFALNGLAALQTIFNDIRDILGEQIHTEMAILTRWGPVNTRGRSLWASLFESLRGKASAGIKEEEASLELIRLEVEKYFDQVFTVPFDTAVYAAQQQGLPISEVAPGSPAGVAYRAIAAGMKGWAGRTP